MDMGEHVKLQPDSNTGFKRGPWSGDVATYIILRFYGTCLLCAVEKFATENIDLPGGIFILSKRKNKTPKGL